MKSIVIRLARIEDAEQTAAIYRPYVEKTAVSFETTPPSAAEFALRIETVLKKYPYLVAEADGEILGYAYASTYIPRAACDWTVEVSIYIREDQRKSGIGKRLYGAIEQILALQNVKTLTASIAYTPSEDPYLTHASLHFHKRMGYRPAGEIHRCGFKFGNWYSLLWMEKGIGDPDSKPLPFRSIHEVREEIAEICNHS